MPPAGLWRAWGPLWRRRASLGGRAVPLAAAAAAALGTLLVYAVTLRLSAARGVAVWDPATPLDALVPALPWTILVYASLYVDYALVAVLAPRGARGAREALRLAQGLLLVAALSGASFVLLPARVAIRAGIEALRPAMAPWLGALYDALWAADAPWNAAPSLHVSHALLLWLALRRWLFRRLAGRLRGAAEAFGWLAFGALCLSTLTTRQHYVVDALSGAALGGLAWWWYVRPWFDGPPQKANESAV